MIEVVRPITLHQPELGEAPDHGPEHVRGERCVDAGVHDPLLLPAPNRSFRPLGELLLACHAHFVDGGVVAGDLLDHAHDRCFLAVAQEVPSICLADALHWGIVVRGGELRIVVRCREPLLLDFGDLSEQLLFRSEVVVVRTVRDSSAFEMSVILASRNPSRSKVSFGHADEARPRLGSAARLRRNWFRHVLLDDVRHLAQVLFVPDPYGTVRRKSGRVLEPSP